MPAITSLDSDSPFASAVRTSTRVRSVRRPDRAPTRRPQRQRPSFRAPPGPRRAGCEGGDVDACDDACAEVALRVASIPLSTIAIVGACGEGPADGAESCCRLDVCCHISAFWYSVELQRRVRRDRGDSVPPREPKDLPTGERRRNAVDGAEPPAELRSGCRESRLHRRHRVADRGRAHASAALHDHAERRVEAAPSQRRASSAERSACLQLAFRRVQSSLRRPQWP